MSTRRSFFSRIGAAIATIALAPELAFRAKLALPEVGAEIDRSTVVYSKAWLFDIKTDNAGRECYVISPKNFPENENPYAISVNS